MMGRTNSAEPKAERLIRLQMELLAAPRGRARVEDLARRLDVSTDTIYRYVRAKVLSELGISFESGWLSIDREKARIRVGLNLDEAMALHLAARMLATRMDRRNIHAADAIGKLSLAIEPVSRPVSRMMRNTAQELGRADQWSDPAYISWLERLTEGIAQGRKARITYFTERVGEAQVYTLSPYWLEPYAVGKSIYVVGVVDEVEGMQIFKLERIQDVELLTENYAIPEAFNPQDLFKDAWGIWFGRGSMPPEHPAQSQRVVLRFSRAKAGRVLQSRWHASQSAYEDEQGRLIWSANVANWTEMLPWIQGWGAEVEVLEPAELRRTVAEDVRRLLSLYGQER